LFSEFLIKNIIYSIDLYMDINGLNRIIIKQHFKKNNILLKSSPNKYLVNNSGNGTSMARINLDKIEILKVVLQFSHFIFLYPEKLHMEDSKYLYENFS